MGHVYVSSMKRCRLALWKILGNASSRDSQSNSSDTPSSLNDFVNLLPPPGVTTAFEIAAATGSISKNDRP